MQILHSIAHSFWIVSLSVKFCTISIRVIHEWLRTQHWYLFANQSFNFSLVFDHFVRVHDIHKFSSLLAIKSLIVCFGFYIDTSVCSCPERRNRFSVFRFGCQFLKFTGAYCFVTVTGICNQRKWILCSFHSLVHLFCLDLSPPRSFTSNWCALRFWSSFVF